MGCSPSVCAQTPDCFPLPSSNTGSRRSVVGTADRKKKFQLKCWKGGWNKSMQHIYNRIWNVMVQTFLFFFFKCIYMRRLEKPQHFNLVCSLNCRGLVFNMYHGKQLLIHRHPEWLKKIKHVSVSVLLCVLLASYLLTWDLLWSVLVLTSHITSMSSFERSTLK